MATKNKEATRFFSSKHENSIAKALKGRVNSSSGSGHFDKGDVVVDSANMLIEAKCSMSPKQSVSIKREWLDKNKEESFAVRKANSAVCINFEPEGDNYYLINEKLMKFLVDKLSEENE